MTTPYGVPGCRCDQGFTWDDREPIWYDNAHCPYHGLLPRERMDTGVYRVVTGLGPCERHPGASTIGGLCAMCTRTPDALTRNWRLEVGRLTTDVEIVPEKLNRRYEAQQKRERGEDPAGGIFATVRRWIHRTLWGCERSHRS